VAPLDLKGRLRGFAVTATNTGTTGIVPLWGMYLLTFLVALVFGIAISVVFGLEARPTGAAGAGHDGAELLSRFSVTIKAYFVK